MSAEMELLSELPVAWVEIPLSCTPARSVWIDANKIASLRVFGGSTTVYVLGDESAYVTDLNPREIIEKITEACNAQEER